MSKKVDKRSKAYRDSIKKEEENKINDPALAGTTETTLVEVIGEELELEVSVEESRLRMNILEKMPKEILEHMYRIIGCECTIKAYNEFQEGKWGISRVFQRILNQAYYELFNEKVKPTGCADCMLRRIRRIRKELKKIIE